MESEVMIYEQGLEEYPKLSIVLGNFAMLLWIGFGAFACWLFNPLIAWTYLAFAILMVYIVLKKVVCTNCYYHGKWCCLGWGKLSAVMFKKGNVEEFNRSIGTKLAPLTYGLLALVPLVLLVFSLVQEFTVQKIALLGLIILIVAYSGAIARKKSCESCKMKLFCKGSAAKKDIRCKL
ncbi:hypothetical protein K8R43_05580 [archaeon]|nr:hypothetical protein [archaeon]